MKSGKRFSGLVFLFFLISLFAHGGAIACSEVFIDENCRISARNFDFMFGDGLVLFTPRGVVRESGFVGDGETRKAWTSRHGSISFWVKLPGVKNGTAGESILAGVDGMNEKGFKVGTYFLETSEFVKGENDTTLSIDSLMQYLLDNFETVEGALNDLEHPDYRVISTPTGSVEVKLHLYLHDAAGDSAIVEFLGEKVVVHRNPEIPVLTNTAYAQALELLKKYREFGGDNIIPGGNESLDRFVRGAFYRKHLPEPASSEEGFDSGLALVQVLSVPPVFAHGCTQWTIVSDIIHRKIAFRTLENPSILSLDFSTFDFSEGNRPATFDLTREGMSGGVSR